MSSPEPGSVLLGLLSWLFVMLVWAQTWNAKRREANAKATQAVEEAGATKARRTAEEALLRQLVTGTERMNRAQESQTQTDEDLRRTAEAVATCQRSLLCLARLQILARSRTCTHNSSKELFPEEASAWNRECCARLSRPAFHVGEP